MKQLSMRKSDLVDNFDTGVPQGCALSPLIFAGTIDHIIAGLKREHSEVIDVVVFADDVVIVCKQG